METAFPLPKNVHHGTRTHIHLLLTATRPSTGPNGIKQSEVIEVFIETCQFAGIEKYDY